MIFKEFGLGNKKTIILLHGGGLSWWSFRVQIEELQKEFHVVTPIIDGHGEDYGSTFISISECARSVITFIKNNCGGQIFAISGLSIGAQIVVEILAQESSITQYAIIESALVYPMKSTTALTKPMYNMSYGLLKKHWFAKLQAKALFVPEDLFEKYFEDSINMSKKSLINLTLSNSNYPMPKTIDKTNANVLILVGEKELKVMKKSAKLLNETIKGSTLKVIEKCGHGEISLKHTHLHINIVKEFFNSTDIIK